MGIARCSPPIPIGGRRRAKFRRARLPGWLSRRRTGAPTSTAPYSRLTTYPRGVPDRLPRAGSAAAAPFRSGDRSRVFTARCRAAPAFRSRSSGLCQTAVPRLLEGCLLRHPARQRYLEFQAAASCPGSAVPSLPPPPPARGPHAPLPPREVGGCRERGGGSSALPRGCGQNWPAARRDEAQAWSPVPAAGEEGKQETPGGSSAGVFIPSCLRPRCPRCRAAPDSRRASGGFRGGSEP